MVESQKWERDASMEIRCKFDLEKPGPLAQVECKENWSGLIGLGWVRLVWSDVVLKDILTSI